MKVIQGPRPGATIATRPPLDPIALNPKFTERHRGRTGKVETNGAGSADGLWWFRRIEIVGTPWELTHLPTGMFDHAGTLMDARRMAGNPMQLTLFRERAQKVLDTAGRVPFTGGRPAQSTQPADQVLERLGLARRVVQVLDELLVPGDPDGLCMCGGFLRGEIHADACGECVGVTVAEQRACRALHEHKSCGDAFPAICDHSTCSRPAAPVGGATCPRGLFFCCSCCLDE